MKPALIEVSNGLLLYARLSFKVLPDAFTFSIFRSCSFIGHEASSSSARVQHLMMMAM